MTPPGKRALAFAAVLLGLGLAFRITVALSFSSSSPDGDQYYALSQSLLRDGRYAFSPPPAPLTYTRLPGYPLVAAAIDGHPRSHDDHVKRAAVANAVFDVATAAVLFALLADLGASGAGLFAIFAVVVCPLTILWSIHALGESLATLLGVLELFLLLRFARTGKPGYPVLAGVVAGLAQMARFDAIAMLPVAALAFYLAPAPRAVRVRAALVFAVVATVVLSPWPIRNLARFGHPHVEGAEWLAQDGTELPTGPIRWMRTWCTSAPGESYLADLMVFRRPFNGQTPGLILPQMVDSTVERQQLATLIDRVGRDGLDAAANDEFIRLARQRTAAHPLRTYFSLPLARLPRLLLPPPLPTVRWVKIPLLGWPRTYWQFPMFYALLYLLCALGTVRLWASGASRVALLFWIAVAARVAIHVFAVPHQVTPRYLVESFPVLIAIAALSFQRPSQRLSPER